MPDRPYADDVLSQMARACDRGYGASISELSERILYYWGGADGIIKEMREEYKAADEGSRVREQILNCIMRILVSGAEDGEGSIDQMDPEDAKAELKFVLKELEKSDASEN